MLLPIRDENPIKIIPFQRATVSIIGICVFVFIVQSIQPVDQRASNFMAFGMIPAVVFHDASLSPELLQLPPLLTLFTSMFLHANFLHIASNMLYLWIFGDNIEDSMGHGRFVIFFVSCGVGSALAHGLSATTSTAPLIGASGAVAGILGAYLVLHPKVKVLTLVFHRIPVNLPAYLMLAVWILIQFVNAAGGATGVAWWAHIGGFFIGAILIIPFRDKTIPLVDKGTTH